MTTEAKDRLKCEKIVNESWASVSKYTDYINKILEKETLTDEDISMLKLAAYAFVQKSLLEKADSIALFGVDLCPTSPCGFFNSCEECNRDKCLLSEE